MSQRSSCGSRSSSPSSPIQRVPHRPMASTTWRSSVPASVKRYCTSLDATCRSITPARSSWLRRFDSSDGDIRGSPRRSSLKCLLPSTSSRTTSSVQRSSSSSMALAMGQNWWYSAPTRSRVLRLAADELGGTDLVLGGGKDRSYRPCWEACACRPRRYGRPPDWYRKAQRRRQ